MLIEKLIESGQIVLGTEEGEWTTEVPIEPNTLWLFYGWPEGRRKHERKPDLMVVEIWQSGSPPSQFLSYVGHGRFLYPPDKVGIESGICGKWKRIGPITLPPLE